MDIHYFEIRQPECGLGCSIACSLKNASGTTFIDNDLWRAVQLRAEAEARAAEAEARVAGPSWRPGNPGKPRRAGARGQAGPYPGANGAPPGPAPGLFEPQPGCLACS